MAFGDRFRDFFGIGEGGIFEGLGIRDETGSHSGGFLGIGATPTSGPGSPGYFEEKQAEADEEARRRTQPIYDEIERIKGLAGEIPSFEEWMAEQGYQLNDITGSDAFTGLEDLVARLQAGPTEEDYDAAYANAARLMGLTAEEAEAMIGGLTNELAGGVEGQEGMSSAEEALRRRQNQANLRQAEQRAQRLVQDSLADTGSTARMLQTADEATMQINNMQLQQDASLAQEQFERQIAQFQAAKEQWAMMVQTNQMGTQQYIENMQQSMGLAIQGYAQQIQTLVAENQQYLQMYSEDRQALMDQINSLYNAANLQLGVTMAEVDLASELYAAEVQPILDELNYQALEDEMTFDLGDFFTDIAIPIALTIIGTVVAPGVGTAAGAAAGAAVSAAFNGGGGNTAAVTP